MPDNYRDRAAYCQSMAEKAPTEEIKAGWLRLAETWLHMAAGRVSLTAEAEEFEAATAEKGTRQTDSQASH